MESTGNELMDELFVKSRINKNLGISYGSYKGINIQFTFDDRDDGCYVRFSRDEYSFRRRNYKEWDCVRIKYNYSHEETKFCMDMLCDASIYHIKGDTGDAIIRCDGKVYVTKNSDYPVGFEFDNWSKCTELTSIVYLTKTRDIMIKIIDICESKEEFIEAYNLAMSSRTKNARK